MYILYDTFLRCGVHLGRRSKYSHPLMREYFLGERHERNIFDLRHTLFHFRYALKIFQEVYIARGRILFVTNHKAFSKILPGLLPKDPNIVLLNSSAPGGFFTNWEKFYEHVQVTEELKENCLDNKGVFQKETLRLRYEKKFKVFKEIFEKDKLISSRGSLLVSEGSLPSLVVFFQTEGAQDLIVQARKLRIPTIGFVSSNCDPSQVTYPIPGNSGNIKALYCYAQIFCNFMWEIRMPRGGQEVCHKLSTNLGPRIVTSAEGNNTFFVREESLENLWKPSEFFGEEFAGPLRKAQRSIETLDVGRPPNKSKRKSVV